MPKTNSLPAGIELLTQTQRAKLIAMRERHLVAPTAACITRYECGLIRAELRLLRSTAPVAWSIWKCRIVAV